MLQFASAPDVGATLRDKVLAEVTRSPAGVKRSALDRDERAVATTLVHDGLIVKGHAADNQDCIMYFPK